LLFETHQCVVGVAGCSWKKSDSLGGSSLGLALLEALPAIDGAALRGLERYGGLTLAAGANRLGFDPLIIAPALRQTKRLGALALAAFTAFRFVLKLFVVEEELFPCGEDEIGATVYTLENLVLELH
jgi:hypothetical protein